MTFDRLKEFRAAFDAVPSQDNEGYVPDRAGFKYGYYAACDRLSPKISELEATVTRLQDAYDPAKYDAVLTENTKLRETLVAVARITASGPYHPDRFDALNEMVRGVLALSYSVDFKKEPS